MNDKCHAEDAKPAELGPVNGRESLLPEQKSSLIGLMEEVMHLQVRTLQMLTSLAEQHNELMAYLIDNERDEPEDEDDEHPSKFLDGSPRTL